MDTKENWKLHCVDWVVSVSVRNLSISGTTLLEHEKKKAAKMLRKT